MSLIEDAMLLELSCGVSESREVRMMESLVERDAVSRDGMREGAGVEDRLCRGGGNLWIPWNESRRVFVLAAAAAPAPLTYRSMKNKELQRPFPVTLVGGALKWRANKGREDESDV
jgi:hypothetical protein